MDTIWNQKKMMDLLQSFFTIARVRVGFFNLEGKEILAYPYSRANYCNCIRCSSEGEHACVHCDLTAYHAASKRRSLHMYQCHAGLTEMIAPIMTSDESLIGYLMLGQVRSVGQNWEDVKHLVEKLPLDINLLKDEYFRLTIMNEEEMKSSAHILQTFAAYVWLDDYIHIQNQPISRRIEKYIIGHLSQPITLAILSDEFGIGKTTLCKVVKKDFNLTVNELIRRYRMEKACELLRSTSLPVSDIAEMAGITDYNYFTKLFKEEKGITPLRFRKLCEAEHLYLKE